MTAEERAVRICDGAADQGRPGVPSLRSIALDAIRAAEAQVFDKCADIVLGARDDAKVSMRENLERIAAAIAKAREEWGK